MLQSGLFGGVGWYEGGYRGPKGEGPHVHVDLRTEGPARWGYRADGEYTKASIPFYTVTLNPNGCPCTRD